MKRTVILGATTNRYRYAFIAAQMLTEHGHEIVPVGIKKGKVQDREILNIYQRPVVEDVDTVTLYLNPNNQKPHYDYLLMLNPRRIIFNPGTENEELRRLADSKGIITEYACTLVLLSTGQY